MTDNQEDQTSMFRTILAIRLLYNLQIAAIADLDSDFDDFEAEVDLIKDWITKQNLQTTGVARDKQAVEEDLIELALIVSGALMAHASKANNNTLFDEVKYGQSQLDRTRDEVLVPTCQIILDRGNTHAAALLARGITAQMLLDLADLMVEFESWSEAPRLATTGKSTATSTLVDRIKAANKILKERLDGGMKIFVLTAPDIYTHYRNGRKIINTRGRQNSNTGILAFLVKDNHDTPLSGVSVTFDNRAGSTDDQGKGTIKGATLGNKLVRFFKPGFPEQFEPAVIQKGITTSITVQMNAGNTGGVEGTVLQGVAHVPASVEVVGTAISTTTNNLSYFYLGNVPQGQQTIRTTIIGSNPPLTQEQVVMVTVGAVITVNFVFP